MQTTPDHGVLSPADQSTTQLLHLGFQTHHRREGGKNERSRSQVIYAETMSSVYGEESVPTNLSNMVAWTRPDQWQHQLTCQHGWWWVNYCLSWRNPSKAKPFPLQQAVCLLGGYYPSADVCVKHLPLHRKLTIGHRTHIWSNVTVLVNTIYLGSQLPIFL